MRRHAPESYSWTFPVPITPSRFQAVSPRWAAWNVQTDPARVGTWSFDPAVDSGVAWYDLQTQPDSNSPGRHGSGRAAIYRGYHVKGIGRTPAAANWNAPDDRYHASGHMSPGSALRELLITRILRRRGLRHSIVSCETVLMGALAESETRAILAARATEPRHYHAADARMIALSLKRANFVRHTNIIWALDHSERSASWIGRFFMAFERLLVPPSSRASIEGTPEAIAAAMDAAFDRAFQRMLDFAANGIFWVHHQNNYTLDGRWVDLETPLFVGRPFAGLMMVPADDGPLPQIAGFECFDMVRSWRLFLEWLDRKLDYLALPGMLDLEAGAAFLKALRAAIRSRFRRESMLRRDRDLRARAVSFLADRLGIDGAPDRRRLASLADFCFRASVHALNQAPPDLGWIRLPEQPVAPSPAGVVLAAAPFAPTALHPDARWYASELHRLGAMTTPSDLLSALR